jgi:hypothetical protein
MKSSNIQAQNVNGIDPRHQQTLTVPMRFVICGGLLLVALLLIAQNPTGQHASESEASPADATFDLQGGYQPDQKLLLLSESEISVTTNRNGKTSTKKQFSRWEILVVVEKAPSPEAVRLRVRNLN